VSEDVVEMASEAITKWLGTIQVKEVVYDMGVFVV